jgi:uncharacterized protein YceK
MRRAVVLAVLLAVMAGCATVRDTPAQARARTQVENCKEATGATTVYVRTMSADGRVRMRSDATSWNHEIQRVKQCLRERYGWRWSDGT